MVEEDPEAPQRLSSSVPSGRPLPDAAGAKKPEEGGNESEAETKKDSPASLPGSAAAATTTTTHAHKSPKLSLEQLNAMAEALGKEDMSAEEKQRQMGVIYSRRKRVRQKMRLEVLEGQKSDLSVRNQRLRADNDRLEAILRDSLARVAAVEQHRRAGGVGGWPPLAGGGAESSEVGAGLPVPGFYPGPPFLMPHLGGGGDGSGASNPILNRIHPLVRLQAEMGYYYHSQYPPPHPMPDVYGHRRPADAHHHRYASPPQRGFLGWGEQPQP